MKHLLPILLLVTMACTIHNPFKQAEQPTINDTTLHYSPAKLPPGLFSQSNAITFLVAGHTANINELRKGIYVLAAKNFSTVKSEFLETTPKGVKGSFVMVVPRRQFDSVLANLGQLPLLVQRQSHSVEDISLTLSSLTQRAREKRDIARRYKRLLQSASSQQEVVRLETAMAINRSDLELLSNEIKDIRSRVDNINITINAQQTIANKLTAATDSVKTPGKAKPTNQMPSGKAANYFLNHWPWLILLGIALFMTMAIFKVTKKAKKDKKQKRNSNHKKKKGSKSKDFAASLPNEME